ncbi:MAG: nicotinate phosphoribosyltransferase [Parcubacteria group bacterium]
MIKDLLSARDLSLFTSGSRFSLARVFLRENMQDMEATFDLFVRELPSTRNYLVFGGLELVAEYLRNLRLDEQQLAWMRPKFHLDDAELRYFKNFHFSGDMFALPEGTIFFPNEPLIRITAPIIEAQIIEMFLINAVYLQTTLASKIARLYVAARGKDLALGFNRSYGLDTAMKATRWSKIFDIKTSLAAYDYLMSNNPPFAVGTFHYLIMAFGNELDAFRAYLRQTQGKGYILVDTYDTIRGIRNFITAAKEVAKEGIQATGIQLDSGDPYELSRRARKMLDEAGLYKAKIFAMGNLDEWKVADLERRKAPIDVYAGVTEILTPTDAPTLELVYKLSEIRQAKKITPKMKTSAKKVSLPGRKKVWRMSKGGRYTHDIIGTEDEKVDGQPLLVPIIKKGRFDYAYPALPHIHKYFDEQVQHFEPDLFSVDKKFVYSVKTGDQLQKLAATTKTEIEKQHFDKDL